MNYPLAKVYTLLYPHLQIQQLLSNFSRIIDWFYLFNPKQLKSPITVRHCLILVKKTFLYHIVIKGICSAGSQRDQIKKYGYYNV